MLVVSVQMDRFNDLVTALKLVYLPSMSNIKPYPLTVFSLGKRVYYSARKKAFKAEMLNLVILELF